MSIVQLEYQESLYIMCLHDYKILEVYLFIQYFYLMSNKIVP